MDKLDFEIKYDNFTYQQYYNKIVFLLDKPSPLLEGYGYKKLMDFNFKIIKGGYYKRLTKLSLLEASKIKWELR
jgi:hypothetical protein